jgi:hypothetical protein
MQQAQHPPDGECRSSRVRQSDTPQDRLLRAGQIAAAPTHQRKKVQPVTGQRASALKAARKVSFG